MAAGEVLNGCISGLILKNDVEHVLPERPHGVVGQIEIYVVAYSTWNVGQIPFNSQTVEPLKTNQPRCACLVVALHADLLCYENVLGLQMLATSKTGQYITRTEVSLQSKPVFSKAFFGGGRSGGFE